MEKLAELQRKLGVAIDELGSDAVVADAVAYKNKETEITDLEGQISRAQAALARSANLARPLNSNEAPLVPEVESLEIAPPAQRGLDGRAAYRQFDHYLRSARRKTGFGFDASKHYRSFGEQLQAVFQYYITKGSSTDGRLVRAPTGAGEVDPTGGGFLVQVDFAEAVFMLAHDMGEILSRVNKIPISANANGIKINAVDETSRATGSRWGGVQSYWVDEGDTVNKTKPKFRRVEFDLKKLMSLMYITDEMLQDSTALTAIAGQAFSEEVMFMTEDGIFEGPGAGTPLGVLNAPCLVTIPKITGQAAATIVKENIDSMWSRMWNRSRKNAVWFINQDAEPQLNQLNQAVGTGGQLVYLPPGGLSAAPYASLYGRPLIATEYNSALGTPGDILLADFSQYTLIDKGGVQAATSMHVAFLTDEMAFRITYRVDGKPMWSVPLTPFKGSLTKSPFIALAQR
jgi:HK97 family phage major capsid protein